MVVFCHTSFANILNNRDHQWDFPIVWKGSFRHILKTSAFKKFSGSHFLRASTGIRSEPDAFGESRLFNIFRVTEILCKFTLVLERKTGKEIPYSSRLEFLGKFLENYFNLSYAEGSISGLPNREDIADLPYLRTLLAIRHKFWEQRSLKVMGFFVLLAYSSLPASRALLQRILAYLNVNLKSEDLFCRLKRKKLFLWTMTAAQAGENYGDKFDRVFPMSEIYIKSNLKLLAKFPSNSSWSAKFKDPISTSYSDETGHPFWVWEIVNGNWDRSMIRISRWRESRCRTNASFRRNRKIQDYEEQDYESHNQGCK